MTILGFSPHPISSRDPSHRSGLQQSLKLLTGMLAFLLLISVIPVPHWLHGQASYLPLHMLLETLAIVISALVFAVGWATYQRQGSANLLVLACAFLGVAILDFSHMLSYQGMPDFITPSDPEKAIAFWLAARAMAALALLWVTWMPWQRAAAARLRWALLSAVLVATALCHLLILGYPEILPRTFIPAEGLTSLKVGLEYLLAAAHLAIVCRLWLAMRRPLQFNAAALLGASGAMALSAICFTLYASVTDHFNLLGHIYKVIAYGFLFRAIFVEAVERPYTQLADSQAQLQATFDAIPDMLFELDEQLAIRRYHASRDSRLDLPAEQIQGQALECLLPAEVMNICRPSFEQAARQGYALSPAFLLQLPPESQWLQLSIAAQHDTDKVCGYVVLARNVSDIKAQQARIAHLAHYDTLTGLPNRTLFTQQVSTALSLAERQQQPLALLFIDLDNFKNINDALGHRAGDELLCAIAKRLNRTLRDGDCLSRQGGDEFVLALPGVDADGAAHVAQRLLAALVRPIRFGKYSAALSASIGIAIYPDDSDDLDSLMQYADGAMYQAKHRGRNQFQFFTAGIQARMARQLELESALRGAISKQQLSLQYQPQWCIATRRLTGVEALLRWHHPELGQVSPAEFIPVAENSGQIITIGDWVMDQALQQLARWRASGHGSLIMAINLSAAQFHRSQLINQVADLLERHQIPASNLELELTEGMAMEDPQQARLQLDTLHSLGVRLAIDDFGTGFSSLAQLRQFKVNTLKIDRTFVDGLGHEYDSEVLVRSIIQLADNLGLNTLAEGVETETQLDLLRQLGCQALQGYLWGKPLSAEAIQKLLEAHQVPCQ